MSGIYPEIGEGIRPLETRWSESGMAPEMDEGIRPLVYEADRELGCERMQVEVG